MTKTTQAAHRFQPRFELLDDGTLMLFGVIGDEFDGLTSAQVIKDIRSLGDEVEQIRVLINSPGGLVSEGLAIYHELATHPASVDVEIAGVAASMASAIAMAGETVRIAENGMVMVHDPFMAAVGTSDDLRKAAEMLDKFGDSLVGIYARKTGLDEARVREMMADETWLDAEEALELGFVDAVIEAAAAARFAELDTSELAHVPAALTKRIRQARRAAASAEKTTEGEPKMARTKTDDQKTVEPTVDETNESPADGGAPAGSEHEFETPEDAQAKERKRAMEIRAIARQFDGQIPDSMQDKYINDGRPAVEFKAAVADYFAKRSNIPNPSPIPDGVFIDADAHDKWMAGMEDWILVKAGAARTVERYTGEKLEPGEFRGWSMVDIARQALEMRGHSTRGMDARRIVREALIGGPRAENAGLGTRSDFPILLENVLHKLLQAAYETAEDRWRDVAAVGSVMDFRLHPRLRLGSLPRLSELNEAGEFEQIHFPDAEKETIKAGTFGNIVGLTREAIVNDDVDGFARVVTMLGRAAARSIDIDLFALFELNAGLGPTLSDGNALFDAAHDNIAATGGAPTIALLEESRILMAQQTDPDGNDFLDLRPAVWVGPIGLGADVRVAINAEFEFDAETSGGSGQFRKPNVVRDLLDTVVDTPRLSGTRWYLLADPDIAPVFEVVFLEGQEGPVIETQEGFRYDGIEWRIRHDYGVGATDFRGATTNPGV